MTEAAQESNAVDALSEHTSGEVRTPDTTGYDEERTGFQRLAAHRPAVIAGVTTEQDVRDAVRFASAGGSRVAVQNTGHGLSTPMEGGVLISTHRMAGVRVKPRERTAWVEAGATWRQVIAEAAPHGLAPLSGSLPGLGAVSYVLGGGVGLLARRYGFAADHVRRVDLVTADGRLHRVTADGDADLFWALRGGGGNFGVVTGVEIELVPVASLYGGGLYFDVEQLPEVLEEWRRWTLGVPEEMTSAVSMLPFPAGPAVPEELRGRHVAQLQVCYSGPEQEGRQLVEPLRALTPCLRDTVRELPYSDSGAVFEEPDQPHAYRSRNLLLPDLDPRALATLPRQAGPSAPAMCVVGSRHLGGALSRPPQVASAVGRREAAYSLGVLSPVQPGEESAVDAVHRDALAPFTGIGCSLNFSFGPLDAERVRSAFDPADYRRLTELKALHDPRMLFRCNHAIPPNGV
ncbi:hypothetical protein FHX42_003313 [Saccharopolyspora lacisalsi]|uniref:FAD-binding PCMH-type domain-containing protein n=1 Tax=Halosaccharopolyspora lacisalsi TaxID=1000566 RepID=A0A839E2H0_9PSEU|nr:FAD-binding oxidoreductase [Halosaccharopolyspora lacisalsi]MBA8825947.1 hypothetical protein [Halosaccharopolyspora lacisalsi]